MRRSKYYLTSTHNIILTDGVEIIIAVSPRELAGEGGEGVEESPGQDHVVVGGH